MSRRATVLAVAFALAEAVGAVLIVATSNHEQHKFAVTALAVTAGVSFVASGLVALRRRPENRTGFYLAATGYLWFFGALGDVNNHVVYSLGTIVSNLTFVPFAALVLAFPTGRLAPRPDRLLVRLTLGFVLIGPPLLLLFDKHPPSCGSHCTDSAFVVYRSPTIERVVDVVGTAITVLLIAAVVAVLVRRWRRASETLRRLLLPVYLAGAGALLILLLSNLLSSFSTTTADALGPLFLFLFAAVPVAFLLGILRSRLARGSVAALAVAVGRGTPLRDAIATALGDPSLDLAYCVDAGFVDRDGRPYELPGPGSQRTATIVEHDGRRVGALVHDESLAEEPELVESVTATVALALDNERLQTEARVQYDRLTTIVDTAPSLLLTLDTEGRMATLNPATLRASGHDDERAVLGRHFWDVFIGEDEREAMIERFRRAAPEFPPSEYENVFTNARGENLVIAWQSAPLRDAAGRVVGITAGGLDITERKRHEEELRASRSRLVAAADDERRRLERNLHDGAQQRLVALSLALRLAESKAPDDPAATAEIIAGASDELARALEELRELARGIHPAVLTDRGLTAALEALAARSPLPVELQPVARRLPEPIEAAAYYVVSESLANVVKHAGASSVDVRLSAENGSLLVEVEDDGVGGADAQRGSGLRGLADRVAALDGELRVESPPRGGTRVVAEIPVP